VDGTVVRVRLLQKIKDAEGTLPVFGAGIFQIGIDDLEGPRDGNAEGAGDCG
jgi:hypothetical protein